ncbi:TatD family hydrolase [Chloroflexota bacterium]
MARNYNGEIEVWMLSDCHAHLHGLTAAELDEMIERSRGEGLKIIVAVGTDMETSLTAVNIAETYDIVYAAVGIHPMNAHTIDSGLYRQLEALARREVVVAISEIGLDLADAGYPTGPAEQMPAFQKQLQLAREVAKPAIIHSRGAAREVTDILRQEESIETVLHDFAADESTLAEAIDLGCYFSEGFAFLAPDTVPNVKNLHEMVKRIPDDRLLLESDRYPRSRHGERWPWDVKRVAQQVAEIRGSTTAEIGRLATDNLSRLLRTGRY